MQMLQAIPTKSQKLSIDRKTRQDESRKTQYIIHQHISLMYKIIAVFPVVCDAAVIPKNRKETDYTNGLGEDAAIATTYTHTKNIQFSAACICDGVGGYASEHSGALARHITQAVKRIPASSDAKLFIEFKNTQQRKKIDDLLLTILSKCILEYILSALKELNDVPENDVFPCGGTTLNVTLIIQELDHPTWVYNLSFGDSYAEMIYLNETNHIETVLKSPDISFYNPTVHNYIKYPPQLTIRGALTTLLSNYYWDQLMISSISQEKKDLITFDFEFQPENSIVCVDIDNGPSIGIPLIVLHALAKKMMSGAHVDLITPQMRRYITFRQKHKNTRIADIYENNLDYLDAMLIQYLRIAEDKTADFCDDIFDQRDLAPITIENDIIQEITLPENRPFSLISCSDGITDNTNNIMHLLMKAIKSNGSTSHTIVSNISESIKQQHIPKTQGFSSPYAIEYTRRFRFIQVQRVLHDKATDYSLHLNFFDAKKDDLSAASITYLKHSFIEQQKAKDSESQRMLESLGLNGHTNLDSLYQSLGDG